MLSNFSSEFDLLTLVFSEYQFRPLLTNLDIQDRRETQ